MELRFCEDKGHVVGAKRRIPTDPTEHYYGPMSQIFGCSRLECVRCGKALRHATGFFCDDVAYGRASEIYATADWTTLPWLGPGKPTDRRLYVCACGVWDELDWRDLEETEDEEHLSHPPRTWRCSGHPLASLPFDMDGIRIHADIDLGALVRDLLDGKVPAGAYEREKTLLSGWPMRLYLRLAASANGAALVDRVFEEVVANVTFDSPPRERCAWALFLSIHRPAHPAIEPLLPRLGAQLDMLSKLDDPIAPPERKPPPTFEHRVVELVMARLHNRGEDSASLGPAAAELALSGLLRSPTIWEKTLALLAFQGHHAFLAEHTGELASTQPALVPILRNLADDDRTPESGRTAMRGALAAGR